MHKTVRPIAMFVLVIIAAAVLATVFTRSSRNQVLRTVPSAVPTPPEIADWKVLTLLNAQWIEAQKAIPFRPTYKNFALQDTDVWQMPGAAQFIGKNVVLVRIEDDKGAHLTIFRYTEEALTLLDVVQGSGALAEGAWRSLVAMHGDPSTQPRTYAASVIRDGEPLSFPGVTTVRENVFIANYWDLQS